MRPIRVVLNRADFAKLVSGEPVRCGEPPSQVEIEILLQEMPLVMIAAITNGDPRAELSKFGNQEPVSMSPADLRANAGYLQASGALQDSADYAQAADDLEAIAFGAKMIQEVPSDNGPALALDIVADEIFKEMDRNLREGSDGPNEKLSAWRTIILQVIAAL